MFLSSLLNLFYSSNTDTLNPLKQECENNYEGLLAFHEIYLYFSLLTFSLIITQYALRTTNEILKKEAVTKQMMDILNSSGYNLNGEESSDNSSDSEEVLEEGEILETKSESDLVRR